MQFGEIIKYLREEQNFTQTEVARACKVSTQCISALEMGTRNPTGSTVAALAQFFGCSADYLLGLEDDFGINVSAPTSPIYTAAEQQIIEQYRTLPEKLKKLVREQLDALTSPNEFKLKY